jgi:hypothetical protein
LLPRAGQALLEIGDLLPQQLDAFFCFLVHRSRARMDWSLK